MSSYKFDIDKFNGSNDFTLWELKMKAILVHQGCAAALEGANQLPATMTDDVKNLMLEKAHSLILLSLIDEVLREVGEETTTAGMWTMLEDKFQKKTLTNCIRNTVSIRCRCLRIYL